MNNLKGRDGGWQTQKHGALLGFKHGGVNASVDPPTSSSSKTNCLIERIKENMWGSNVTMRNWV